MASPTSTAKTGWSSRPSPTTCAIALGWESVYAYNAETFGPDGTLGRASEREVVLVRDLRAALARLNPDLPESAREQAVEKLTRIDFARSLVQHNREFYGFIRGGVPVEWRDASRRDAARARAGDRLPQRRTNNRFLAVRELKIQGVRVPHYNRRADLVCFVNGLPLVFIELKAVYRNIRAGLRRQPHRLPDRAQHRPRLPPQRLPGGEQRRPGPLRLDHQQVGALRRVEAQRREGQGRAWTPRRCSTGCWPRSGCSTWSRTSSCSTTAGPGGTRKIVARNHQVLGVNNAVASVVRQEELKRRFPPGERLIEYRVPMPELLKAAEAPPLDSAYAAPAGHRR